VFLGRGTTRYGLLKLKGNFILKLFLDKKNLAIEGLTAEGFGVHEELFVTMLVIFNVRQLNFASILRHL
jgi:hypothetical protein